MVGKKEFTLRQRIHYWFCDLFNIVSYDDFYNFCENLDKYFISQNNFNRLVGDRLHLKLKDDDFLKENKKVEKDNNDRGMFG